MQFLLKITILAIFLFLSSQSSAEVSINIVSDYEGGIKQYEAGNMEMAVIFFQQGVDKGDPKSMFALGSHYYLGQGVEKDFSKALSLFNQSSSKNYFLADAFLGLMYQNGEGVPVDLKRASEHYTKAAYACSDQAQNLLAHMLYQGVMGSPDKVSALAWLYVAKSKMDKNVIDGINIIEAELTTAQKQAANQQKIEIVSKLKCIE